MNYEYGGVLYLPLQKQSDDGILKLIASVGDPSKVTTMTVKITCMEFGDAEFSQQALPIIPKVNMTKIGKELC